MPRKIILSPHAGFCFGVKRSVEMAYGAVEQNSQNLYMLGEIIHNDLVVNELIKKGVKLIHSPDEIKGENARVIIRAHGEAKKIYDRLGELGVECIDTTCPFVRKIHRIVEKHHEAGDEIIIIGDKAHPEVIGINGWCEDSANIYKTLNELQTGLENSVAFDIMNTNVCLVAQTTINKANWRRCLSYVKANIPNAKTHDTICLATEERQNDAAEISKVSDTVIVIGGRKSSNTLKLVEVCREHCKNVFHIETPKELKSITIGRDDKVGITAGASTPAFIIREVIERMEDEKIIMDNNEELSFAEAVEQSIKSLHTGDVVTGIVSKILPGEIRLDLGTKQDGYIPADEFTSDPNANLNDLVKVGDEVEAFVVRVSDVEGGIMLSKKKIDSMKMWKEVEAAVEDQRVLSGVVTEAVRGGVVVMVNGVRVFVPASLAAERYTEDLSGLVGTNVDLRILEINRQRKRVIGSIKSVLVERKAEAAKKIWDEIEVGKAYKGIVKSIMPYGAFVDIGGVDGMLHISEMSWQRIKNPSEIMAVGDEIDVFILKLDTEGEKKKISLGHKKPEDNPWEIFKSKYNVGDVVSCRIIKLMPFGAFAQIVPGVDGLIHVSQIAQKHIPSPESELSIDQVVDAKITAIDFEKKKVNLSIRALLDAASKEVSENAEAQAAQTEETAESEAAPAEAPADAE